MQIDYLSLEIRITTQQGEIMKIILLLLSMNLFTSELSNPIVELLFLRYDTDKNKIINYREHSNIYADHEKTIFKCMMGTVSKTKYFVYKPFMKKFYLNLMETGDSSIGLDLPRVIVKSYKNIETDKESMKIALKDLNKCFSE